MVTAPQVIRVANAPCSWGVLEFDLEGQTLSGERTLAEMALAGYAGTELGDWGFLPTEPRALHELCARHGLALLGAFVPVPLADARAHPAGVEAALRVARLLAAAAADPVIVLADDNGQVRRRTERAGRIEPADGLDAAGWRTFTRGAELVARRVREETGLRTVFHHHCAGWVETPAEVTQLLEGTSPELLGLCLDLGHYAFGGGDPLAALRAVGDRIWHVHLKDCQPEVAARSRAEGWDYFAAVRQGVFCELGRGQVRFPEIVAELRSQGYRGWAVVEQDVLPGMGTPLESARRNRDYLRTLGL